jgi:hypothetical protein
MDPNACLERIQDAASNRERREACEDLHRWISNGGFHPNWNDYPVGTARYRKHFGLGGDLRA